jgi:hypothetical protein
VGAEAFSDQPLVEAEQVVMVVKALHHWVLQVVKEVKEEKAVEAVEEGPAQVDQAWLARFANVFVEQSG